MSSGNLKKFDIACTIFIDVICKFKVINYTYCTSTLMVLAISNDNL